jgi:Asp-tRNA(Asn)/Glu-tRNA(Gln) amidotransferase C subunit
MQLDKISPEAFEKIIEMAAFSLDGEEKAYLLEQLNHQLQSVQELLNIPLEDETESPLARIPRVGDQPRSDDWQAFEKPREIIAMATQNEDGMILVPEPASGKELA